MIVSKTWKADSLWNKAVLIGNFTAFWNSKSPRRCFTYYGVGQHLAITDSKEVWECIWLSRIRSGFCQQKQLRMALRYSTNMWPWLWTAQMKRKMSEAGEGRVGHEVNDSVNKVRIWDGFHSYQGNAAGNTEDQNKGHGQGATACFSHRCPGVRVMLHAAPRRASYRTGWRPCKEAGSAALFGWGWRDGCTHCANVWKRKTRPTHSFDSRNMLQVGMSAYSPKNIKQERISGLRPILKLHKLGSSQWFVTYSKAVLHIPVHDTNLISAHFT